MEVNLYGVLHFVGTAVRLHRAQALQASFVCVSSTSNIFPNPQCLGYYASKLLLAQPFRQFDKLYRSDGVRFKTVILGPVKTNIAVNATLPRWQQWVREQITVSVEDAVSAIVSFVESNRTTLYYPKRALPGYLAARLLA